MAILDSQTNPEWREIIGLRSQVQNEFVNQGHLSPQVFEKAVNWKLRRQRNRTERHRENLTRELIIQITGCFYSTVHHNERVQREVRINLLQSLPGVGIGIATAILTLAHPQNYGIIDYRVWKVLYGKKKKTFTLKDYHKYLEDIRRIGKTLQCDVQEVDYLLWKEFEA